MIQFAPLSRCSHPSSYLLAFPIPPHPGLRKLWIVLRFCVRMALSMKNKEFLCKKQNSWHVHIEINVINGVFFILSECGFCPVLAIFGVCRCIYLTSSMNTDMQVCQLHVISGRKGISRRGYRWSQQSFVDKLGKWAQLGL